MSRQAVSKWERAESLPDIGNVLALEDLYDVTVDELLRGKGPGNLECNSDNAEHSNTLVSADQRISN